MNQAIGLTATQFGFGAGVFFVGYCLLEIPSNIALYRVGARRLAVAHHDLVGAGVGGDGAGGRAQQFLRAAPAARRRRSRILPGRGVLSRDVVSRAVPHAHDRVVHGGDSGVVGHRWPDVRAGCSGSNGVGGLAGWQWMFLLEGLPVVFDRRRRCSGCSPIVPRTSTWLTDEERRIVRDRLAAEQRPREVRHSRVAIRDVRVLILALRAVRLPGRLVRRSASSCR